MRVSYLYGCPHTRRELLWVLAVVVRFLNHGAVAQVYTMTNMPIPGNRSLHMLYTFYVYSSDEAPDRSVGDPIVKYEDFVAHSAAQPDAELKDYYGVQLSVIKYEDFWTLIDPKHFCCSPDEVTTGLCAHQDQLLVKKAPGERYRDVAVYTDTVRFPDGTAEFKPKDVTRRVRETGVYLLMISNCGSHQSASVTGTVTVKNAYGFLPGNEYYKLTFYARISLVYAAMGLVWLGLSMKWWNELFTIQNCIGGVILLGLVECSSWWLFFHDWNTRGTRANAIFVMAALFSVVKCICSYMLVLVAALGWGVTRPHLDQDTLCRIKLVSFAYIVLGVAREVVVSFMHSHSLSLPFVMLCLLPVSLLNGAIFYWVFTALSTLMQALKERGQTAKLQLFQRLYTILILALTIACAMLLYQLFSFSRSLVSRWMYQWLFTDGISHDLFITVLLAMMYLWAPSSEASRYAYAALESKDAENEDGKPAGQGTEAEWIDEPDDEDDESFWSATKGAPPSDAIGATSSAAEPDKV